MAKIGPYNKLWKVASQVPQLWEYYKMVLVLLCQKNQTDPCFIFITPTQSKHKTQFPFLTSQALYPLAQLQKAHSQSLKPTLSRFNTSPGSKLGQLPPFPSSPPKSPTLSPQSTCHLPTFVSPPHTPNTY